MGGDNAPAAVVEGAIEAARTLEDLRVVLAGPEAEVRRELERHDASGLPVEVCDAPDTIGMDDSPVEALRRKKKSALHVGAGLIREGEAQGLVSAGNTGAVMAVYKVIVGTLAHVERPALAACAPTPQGATVLLDVGANVSVRSSHLQQFAVMGHFYSQLVLGVESPRVGVLSVGEEESKGSGLTKEVFELLRGSTLNFVGNVEGGDVFSGDVDVVVTDGFTGNVALKVSEAAVEALVHAFRAAAQPEEAAALKAVLGRTMKKFDYAEYGGAPLLGVRGACIVCHGRSDARAVKNGIRAALEFAANRVDHRIDEELTRLSSGSPA